MELHNMIEELVQKANTAVPTQSKELTELASALSKAQGEFSSLDKGEKGYGYSYTSLAATIEAIRPILSKNGLSVSQLLEDSSKENSISIKTMILHSSGQFLSSTFTMPVPEMKGVTESQRKGAACSYGRRYALQAILNLGTEDNDASAHGFDKPKSSSNFKKEAKAEEKKDGKKPNFRRKKKEETASAGGL